MNNELSLALKAEGLEDVRRALQGMKDAVIDSEREASRATLKGVSERIKAVRSEHAERIKLAKEIAKVEREFNTITRVDTKARNALVGSNTSNIFGNGLGSFSSLFSGASSGLGSLTAKAGVAGAAFALVKTGVDIAVDSLKMFGSFLINDVIRPGFKLQTTAQQLANGSRGAITAQDAESRSRAIGLRYNQDPQKVLESAGDFGEMTGNYDLAFKTMDTLSAIQKAYGGNLEDYAKLAGNLYTPGMSPQDLKNQLLTQVGQGQAEGGKYTIKQIANLGGGINEPASFLAGPRDVTVPSVTAAVQQAGKTSKSVDEALTSVRRFLEEVAKNDKGLHSKSLNKDGQITDIRQATMDALVPTHGGRQDKAKAAGFQSEESRKYLSNFTESYNNAMKGQADTEENRIKAAEKATEAMELLRLATTDEAEVKQDAAKTMAISGEKLEAAFANLKDKLAAEVLPAADKFVDEFTRLSPQLLDATIVLAKAMIWASEVILGVMKVFGKTPSETVSAGQYHYNPSTGKFTFQEEQFKPFDPNQTIGGPNHNVPYDKGKRLIVDETAEERKRIPKAITDFLSPPSAPVTPEFGPPAPTSNEHKSNNMNTFDSKLQGASGSLDEFIKKLDASGLSIDDFNRNNPLGRK